MLDISILVGKQMRRVWINTDMDEMYFETSLADGDRTFAFYHENDCCENVSIEDVIGDLDDLVGSPITMAEQTSSDENPKHENEESFTWTFYRFATIKGYVTVRWYGSSNGYYSESVSFREAE